MLGQWESDNGTVIVLVELEHGLRGDRSKEYLSYFMGPEIGNYQNTSGSLMRDFTFKQCTLMHSPSHNVWFRDAIYLIS